MSGIVHTSDEVELARRIEGDLREAGLGDKPLLIVVLSPKAEQDSSIREAIVRAQDEGQRILPVLVEKTPLPEVIEHLEPVDFSAGYDFEALRTRLAASAMPMKVHTPSVRTANRRFAYVAIAVVLLWFLIGLLLIGGGAIAFPTEEYNTVNTEVATARNAYLETNIPRSTQDAIGFPGTVEAAPSAQRPYLIATATAQASGQ